MTSCQVSEKAKIGPVARRACESLFWDRWIRNTIRKVPMG
jgi:hypothetical protein